MNVMNAVKTFANCTLILAVNVIEIYVKNMARFAMDVVVPFATNTSRSQFSAEPTVPIAWANIKHDHTRLQNRSQIVLAEPDGIKFFGSVFLKV